MAKILGEPELIVVARSDVALRAAPSGLTSLAGADTASLNEVCAKYGGTMRPLFGTSEERLLREAANHSAVAAVPNLSIYYRVEAPAERLHDIARELRDQPVIEAAYVKPPAGPPRLIEMPPRAEEAPSATPDFLNQQGYLEAAPGGIGARHAWTFAGGRGFGVRIIDIEGAWRFSHEDLTQNQSGVVGGTPSPELDWRNHGTAVIGVLGGDGNGKGVTGICPDAVVSAISIFGPESSSAAAIRAAANRLQPGDIILIELHRPGPRHNFEDRLDQAGYIAVEWWQDDFDAILFATQARGVIVVEAAGNGAEDLDDPIYSTPAAGFPASWANPFNRSRRDSGSILVGAGAPPPGTHGRDHGPDRSRLPFSNFGMAIDAQGWGEEVTTCGYGDLQNGSNEDLWYTNTFSGTSSASPMVVGALACVQGFLRARGLPLLTPALAREHLRTTGSMQLSAPGRSSQQNIGGRPNLRTLILVVTPKTGKESKEKEGKDSKEKEHKDQEKIRPHELVKAPNDFIARDPINTGADKNVADRLAGLEQAVARLAHFIGPDLRPDLVANTLAYDEQQSGQSDAQTLSDRLRQQAQKAKAVKDAKDIEKLSDS